MKKVLILACMILLSGCGDNTPKCNSDDTLDTLRSVISQNKGLWENLSIDNIRTVKKDASVGIGYCAADISYTIKATPKTAFIGITEDTNFNIAITFTTQLTDDGKNIYVNVWGLQ